MNAVVPRAGKGPAGLLDAEVVVVGAGAAGVGVATMLRRAGVHVVILEQGDRPGSRWLRRYDRLRLHTARRFSHVAGARLRPRDRFVPAKVYADHVAAAARAADLDVRCRVRVVAVEPAVDGVLVRRAVGDPVRAAHVVLATGQNDVPVEPALPGRASSSVRVQHADTYRDAAPFIGRRVLVVGAGNTGSELAHDLAEHGAASVALAVRSVPPFVPRTVGPVPGHVIGVLLHRAFGERGMQRIVALVGRVRGRMLARYGLYPPSRGTDDAVPTFDHGIVRCVASGTVALVPALVDVQGDAAVLADGSRLEVDDVLLATGYRPAAGDLLPSDLSSRAGDLSDPTALSDAGIWFVGFGRAPLGQLVLAREHAYLVAERIAAG